MDAEHNQNRKTKNFVGFVLLEQPAWDKEEFLRRLEMDWQLQREDRPLEQEDENTLVFQCQGAMVSVALMPAPIPGGEAERQAAKNYRWPGGVEQVKGHKAHLVVGLLNVGLPQSQAGLLTVKILASCCRQSGVLGVYTNGVVYQPQFYLDCSRMMEDGEIPLFNLVWFGLYRGEKGLCGYTMGLENLGYDEMEVLDSAAAPEQLVGFLANVSHYVLSQNVTLRAGETIGFSAEQKLTVSRGPGAAVEGDSLKIDFPG